jgi:hypothetical protein
MDKKENQNSEEMDIVSFFKDSDFLELPHYSIRLYQKVDERKNIIPFERRYHEKWEVLTIAAMFQQNAMKSIREGKYPKDTFVIEIENALAGEFMEWCSEWDDLEFRKPEE